MIAAVRSAIGRATVAAMARWRVRPAGGRTVTGVGLVVVSSLVSSLVLGACGGVDDGDADGDGAAGWCEFGERIGEQDLVLESIDLLDPDAVRVGFESTAALYDEAYELAPDAIRADVAAIRDAFGVVEERLAAVDFDLLALDDNAFDVFDAETDRAGERIEAYGVERCGFFDPGDPSAVIPPATVVGDEELAEIDALLRDEEFMAGIRDELTAQFESEGYSTEQARCLASAFDVQAFLELEVDDAFSDDLRARIEACGVDPADLEAVG